MKIKALVLAAAFAIPTIASAQDTAKSPDTAKSADPSEKPKSGESAKLEAEDLKIVAHLNHVHMMEIDMGKMAQKSGTAKVKKYGAMLVKDHTAANKQLKALAKKKGVTKIPEDVPTTEAEKKDQENTMAAMEKIKGLKGAEFDREFLTMMAADHDKEVSRVDMAVAMVKEPELATHLRNLKPTLQRHADQARELMKTSEVSSK